MGYTANKYLAELLAVDKDRAARILRLCDLCNVWLAISMTAAVVSFSKGLSIRVFPSDDLTLLFRIGGAALLFQILVQFQAGVLSGFQEFKALGRCMVISSLATAALVTVGAKIFGLPGALAGTSLGFAGRYFLQRSAVTRTASDRGMPVAPANYLTERSILWKFTLPILLSFSTGVTALWSYNFFLGGVTDGFNQIAQYAVSLSYINCILLVAGVINSVTMTKFNHHRGSGDTVSYTKLFWKNLLVTSGVTVAVVGAAAGGSIQLLQLFGTSFLAAAPVFHILLLAAVPEAITICLYQVVQSKSRMWESMLWINLPRDSVMVIVGWMLAPQFGARGIAIAYLAARLVTMVSCAIFVRRIGIYKN